jgi:L-rhamnose isomerase
MTGDITILREGAFGAPGSRKHAVAAGTTASIKPGELCLKVLGNASVTAWTANNNAKPVVSTDYIVGLSATTSTETATAVGTVEITPIVPGMVLLGNPKVAATWDTQAEYDALVGDRVLLDTTTTGVQSLLAVDGATHGLVIEPLDVTKYPGKVAFSVRAGALYNA